jgi:hypothetical protein
MTAEPSASTYVLGHADVEIQRLLLQARPWMRRERVSQRFANVGE